MPTDISSAIGSVYSELGISTVSRDRGKSFYERIGKRVFDVSLAFFLLPVLVPIIFLLWVLVKRDGGAGFYAQPRIGKDGKAFRCWKIRTMVVDADRKLATFLARNPDAMDEWDAFHKLSDDPRITRVGAFLRQTSLDELPQIWNVIRGEMSFVGPRPVVRAEVRRYGSFRYTYLSMKPGITGVWQTSARNDVCFADRADFDNAYYNTMSVALDTKLVLKTALVVLNRTGV